MKVFVIAYACEPNRQSEPGLGWNIAGEIARRHDVTVLTRANNRERIERHLAANPNAPQRNIRFVYHDRPGVLMRFKKSIPFGEQLYFSAWLKSAVAAHRAAFADYDVVHHLTLSPFFVKPWGAAFTTRYVWGPIGGGGGADARYPRSFPLEGWRNRFNEWLYRAISRFVYSPLAWRFRRLRRRVAAVTFKARAFAAGFPVAHGQISAVVQETGYDGAFPTREYDRSPHPLKVVAVGRMIPHKGFEYAIRGFLKFLADGGEGELHVFGDGPLRGKLEALSDDKVVFHGNVPNAQVHAMLDGADVFLHGSFIEAAAWSIIEAMVHGVPVVCQNRSGMADMVTDECGTKVKAATPDELTDGFANALGAYYRDPGLVETHGLAGQRRVREHYSWKVCGEALDKIYAKVVEKDGNTGGGGIETAARG